MTHSAPLQAHAGISLQAPGLYEQRNSLIPVAGVSRLHAQHLGALRQRCPAAFSLSSIVHRRVHGGISHYRQEQSHA